MNLEKTNVIPNSKLRDPRKKLVIVLEDLNFLWDEPELKELKHMWMQGFGVDYMADYFERDADEILLALIHLSRDGKITQRKGGLLGTK